jgi:hypothetical protein
MIGRGIPEPSISNYDLNTYMAGMYLRQRVQGEGLQLTRTWINQHSQRNASRILDKYRDFIPSESASENELTTDHLFEIYKQSITKQLTGENECEHKMSHSNVM